MSLPTTPPAWVQDAVFYQIFPDRFRNGDPGNDPRPLGRWGDAPAADTFCGGDLAGICEQLPYLQDLGVNALYLNPIFSSPPRFSNSPRTFPYSRLKTGCLLKR